MTGTVDSSTTVRIREAPPRGISTSTRPRARISSRDRLAALAGHQLHGVGGQPGAADGVAQHPHQGGVRGVRGGRAAQQDGVAGLQAERGGVDRDVGAGLVDDPDDAERDADLAQVDAVGQGRAAHDLADRVGQRGHVPDVGGDGRAPARG